MNRPDHAARLWRQRQAERRAPCPRPAPRGTRAGLGGSAALGGSVLAIATPSAPAGRGRCRPGRRPGSRGSRRTRPPGRPPAAPGSPCSGSRCTVSRPIPGHENSVSTTIAPETTNPRLIADSATTGRIALRVGVAQHAVAGQADRAGGRDEVLAQHVGQRRAHDHDVLADRCPMRQRDDRQRRRAGRTFHVAERRERSAPGSDFWPVGKSPSVDGEEPDQDHARPEVRHRVEEQRPLRRPRCRPGSRGSRPARCPATSR